MLSAQPLCRGEPDARVLARAELSSRRTRRPQAAVRAVPLHRLQPDCSSGSCLLSRQTRRRVETRASSVPPPPSAPPPLPPPPASVWETKPPWCQPWTIVGTGTAIVWGSHGILGLLGWWEWLTVLPAVAIGAWWYLFLVLYANSWQEAVDEAGRRGVDWRDVV
jgi:hypothetical protein